MSISKEKADYDLIVELEADSLSITPEFLKKAIIELIRLNTEMLSKM